MKQRINLESAWSMVVSVDPRVQDYDQIPQSNISSALDKNLIRVETIRGMLVRCKENDKILRYSKDVIDRIQELRALLKSKYGAEE